MMPMKDGGYSTSDMNAHQFLLDALQTIMTDR